MSQVIEDRVVQLDFENYDFEKGAAQSLKTLDKLKSSLNFDDASKNLTAISNASNRFDLSGISSAVEQVGEKFSYMKYAGLVALGNLVDGAVNAGKRLVSALTSPIMSGGWNRAMNLEQANFMMKGLLKDEAAVQAVMKDVNTSVDGTAYSLDAAAKVAAQFAASGLKAGENMLPALQAVAGTAAMTNSSFEEIGQIFTTVAGQGKLMTYQMRQLEFRGLNVAATLGEQLGKSESEIRDMVTKGTISFNMFADAMNSAFGEHAQEANNTFQGAMSNVRSALGRIGAEFATPFIHNAIPALNAFRLAINAVKGTMSPIFTETASLMEAISETIVSKVNGFTSFIKKHSDTIKNIMKDIIEAFKNSLGFLLDLLAPIGDAFNAIFPPKTIAYVRKISVAILNFTKNLKVSEETAMAIKVAFGGLFSLFDSFIYIVKNVVVALKPFTPALETVGHAINKLAIYFGASLLKFNEFLKTSEAVQNVFTKISEVVSKASVYIREVFSKLFDGSIVNESGFMGVIGKITNFIKTAISKAADVIKGLLPTLKGAFGSLPDILENIFGIIKKLLGGLTDSISKFVHSQDFKDLLSLGAKGGLLYSIMNFAKGIGKGSGVESLFGNIFNINFGLFNKIGNGIVQLGLALQKNANAKIIHEVGVALLELAAALAILSGIDSEKLHNAISAVIALAGGLALVAYILMNATNGFGHVIKEAGDAAEEEVGKFIQTIRNIKDSLLGVFKNFGAGLSEFMSASGYASKIFAVSHLIETLATSILMLSVSVLILSKIDMKGIAKSLVAITVMMLDLVGAVAIISKFDMQDDIASVGRGFTSIAKSILILAVAMRLIGSMETADVIDSVFAIGIFLAEFTVLAVVMSGLDKQFRKACGGFIYMAVALGIMATTITTMSKTVDFNNIIPTILSLTWMLLAITPIIFILGNTNFSTSGYQMRKAAMAFSIMSSAILIIAQALTMVGNVMNGRNLLPTIISLEFIIASLVGVMFLVEKLSLGTIAKTALSFVIIAEAFLIMSQAIVMLAKSVSGDNLIPLTILLVTMIEALVYPLEELAKKVILFKKIKPNTFLKIAGSLAIMASAFTIMAYGIKLIAESINFQNVVPVLFTIAMGIAALVIPLHLLTNACAQIKKFNALTMLGVAGSMAIFAAGLLEVSAAILLISMVPLDKIGSTMRTFSLGLFEVVGSLAILTFVGDRLGQLDLQASAFAFQQMGTGLLLVSAAFVALAAMPLDKIKAASVALNVFTGIVSTLMAVLALIASSGLGALGVGVAAGAILALGAAFLMIGKAATSAAIGFNIIVQAISSFANVNAKKLSVNLKLIKDALDGLFGSLVKWSILATILSGPISILTKIVLRLGVSMIPLVMDIKILSKSLLNLAKTIVILVGLGEKTGKAIRELGVGINQLIVGLVHGLVTGLRDAVVLMAAYSDEIRVAVLHIAHDLIPLISQVILVLAYEMSRSFREYGPGIAANFASIFNDLLGVFASYTPQFARSGLIIIIGMMDAMSEKMEELSDSFIHLFLTFLDVLAKKIIEFQPEFEKAFDKLFAATVYNLSKWNDHFKDIGRDFVNGFVSGMLDSKVVQGVSNACGFLGRLAVDKLRDAIDSHSDSKETIKVGHDYVSGFGTGIKRYKGLGLDPAFDLGSESVGQLTSGIESATPDLEGTLDGLWDVASNFGLKVFNGSGFISNWLHNKTKDISGSFTDLTNKVKEGSLSWGDYAGAVSPVIDKLGPLYTRQEQVKMAFEQGGMSFSNYQTIMKDLETEIGDLIGDLGDLNAALTFLKLQAPVLSQRLGTLESKFRSGKISEGEYRAESQKLFKAQSETAKAIELLGDKVFDTDKKTKDGAKSLDEYGNSASGAGEKVKEFGDDLEKTLEGQLKIFEEYKKDDPMNPDQLIKNMTDQINAMTGWATNMDKLAAMGIDKGLYEKLAEMGPEGSKYVEAFASMTADQLVKANELFQTSIQLPASVSKHLVDSFNNWGTGVVDGFTAGVNNPKSLAEMAEAVKQIPDQSKEIVAGGSGLDEHSPSKVMQQYGQWADDGFTRGIVNHQDNVYNTMKVLVEHILKIVKEGLDPAKFQEIGVNLVDGLSKGLEDESALARLRKVAEATSKIPEKVAKFTTKEQSPSKVFYEIGKFLDLGLANGIHDYTDKIVESSEDMSNMAINSMRDTISKISDFINNDMDDPVIRPVLDLSNVQNGARYLNSMLSSNQAYAISGSMNQSSGVNPRIGGTTFIQNNYSPKALSRADIYRQTRNQFSQYTNRYIQTGY